MKEKSICVFKYLQLITFLCYFACISFFTHAHIINGVTIVHSHPFSKTADGTPSHAHDAAEIVLIHQLSAFYSNADVVDVIIINKESVQDVHTVPNLYQDHLIQSEHLVVHTLRPPPVC